MTCRNYAVKECGDANGFFVFDLLSPEDGSELKARIDLGKPIMKCGLNGEQTARLMLSQEVRKGDLISCEFAYLRDEDGFNLALVAFRNKGKKVGLLTPLRLTGQSFVPIKELDGQIEHYERDRSNYRGRLVWIPGHFRDMGFWGRFRLLWPIIRPKDF